MARRRVEYLHVVHPYDKQMLWLQQHIECLLTRAEHPRIAAIEKSRTGGGVRTIDHDGSTCLVKVIHAAPANEPLPRKPSYPNSPSADDVANWRKPGPA